MRNTLHNLSKCALLAVTFSGCGSAFSNGEWASEVDLRVSYCLSVRKAQQKEWEDIAKQIPPMGSESDKKKLSTLDEVSRFEDMKLSSYLSKRAASMNSKSIAQITAAHQAGEAASEIGRNIRYWCSSELSKKNTDFRVLADELKKCTEESGVKQLRLNACSDLSWFPY